MTICSVYPIENYNRGMGGNSNFARPMLPTYRGCTVYYGLIGINVLILELSKCFVNLVTSVLEAQCNGQPLTRTNRLPHYCILAANF